MPFYEHEDPAIEQAANLYEKLKPHLIAVPLKYDNEFGWIPKFSRNSQKAYDYLCSRGDGVDDSGKFDVPKVMTDEHGMIAILWEPRLRGFSPPTFEQFHRLFKQRINEITGKTIRQIKEVIDVRLNSPEHA